MTYYIFVAIGLLFLIVLVFNRIRTYRFKQKLMDSWGNLNHITKEKDNLSSLHQVFEEKLMHDSSNGFIIDQQTWDDLSLQDVFTQINQSFSSLGAEFIYHRLRFISYDSSEDHDFETLQSYMSNHARQRTDILYYFSQLGKQNFANIPSRILGRKRSHFWQLILYYLLGIMPILCLFLSVFQLEVGLVSALVSVAFNVIFYYVMKYKIVLGIDNYGYLIRMFLMANQIAKIDSPLRDKIKQNLAPFKSLSVISFAFRRPMGMSDTDIIFEYLNIIFMIPFIAYAILQHRLDKHEREALNLYENLSKLEAAIAVANYKTSLPYYCLPTFTKEDSANGQKIYHPLIENAKSNPLNFSDNMLITGDNASGKSTYIRMIAINLIMSQSLNFAFAKEFSLKKGKVLTAMSIVDDISQGDSYFISECKAIKRMVDTVAKGEFTYFFLDEIFKGTNTIDRVSSALSIIQYFQSRNCRYMISTHDIELMNLSEDSHQNFCFTSTYQNGEVLFDYILREGKTMTKNAVNLLETLAYPDEIVSKARAYSEEISITCQFKK